MPKLKSVKLVFENCETLTIPGKEVRKLYVNNITRNGHGANLWCCGLHKGNCHSGWYSESQSADTVEISVTKKFLDQPFYSFDSKKPAEYSNYERIIKWSDIAQIYIVNKEYGYKWFVNPFKAVKRLFEHIYNFLFEDYSRLMKENTLKEKWRVLNCFHPLHVGIKSCLHWRKRDSSYYYLMPWYFNDEMRYTDEAGNTHDTDCSNKYQKVKIIDDDEELTVNILIERDRPEC